MSRYPTYSVAIRTLGKAGDKFQETLNSVACQTLKPERVLVYIPWGYELPKETVQIEEYVRCDKGMVTQRSLPFDEITSDFILFLDDDLSFKPDFVKILFDDLLSMDGDCISPDIFSVHKDTIWIKMRNFFGGTIPHWDKDWSFKIRKDAHYSYNFHPTKPVLLSQSGAGACILCRKSAYSAIHFEDEIWMDEFHFGLGEDQLFFYKLYSHRFKVLTAFNANIVHLNAGSGHYSNGFRNYEASGFCRYVIWYRTIYSKNNSFMWRLKCRLALVLNQIRSCPLDIATIIKHMSFGPYCASRNGIKKAKQFVKSSSYLKIPSFF